MATQEHLRLVPSAESAAERSNVTKTAAPARIIAIGGGKGGVGKSVIAGNLAVAMARFGRATVLLDADFGMANQHTMFGIDRPRATLHEFFQDSNSTLADVLLPTAVENLQLIAGSSAHPADANLNHGRKRRLLGHIRRIATDVLIIDVGAGMHYNTVDLFDVADLRILVTSPQLPSLQNTYAFAKAALHRTLRSAAQSGAERDLLQAAQDDYPTASVVELVRRISHVNPTYGAAIVEQLNGFNLQLMGNLFVKRQDRDTLFALGRMMRDFLGIDPTVAGYLSASERINESVNQRKPLLLGELDDRNALTIEQLAGELLRIDIETLRAGRLQQFVITDVASNSVTDESGQALDQQQRRHPRFRVDLQANIVSAAQQIEAHIDELSRSGARLTTQCQLVVGEEILLRIIVGKRRIIARATVRNVREGVYGVEFDRLDSVPISIAG